MKKVIAALILVILVIATMPGCAVITGEETGEPSGAEIPATTEFGRMLGLVPYSLFEQYDIFYGNPGRAKQLHGIADVSSIEDVNQLTKDEKWKLAEAWSETPNIFPDWGSRHVQLIELIGFSIFSFDRAILINNVPPRCTSIASGDFDEGLIEGKLTGLGYSKTDYGKHTYYEIRGDFEIDLKHPLSRMVMAGMNRVAVLDGMLIISPVTEDVTAILDTVEGKTPSVMSSTMCQALAENLGEPLAATLTAPERIVSPPDMADQVPFDFTITESWGQLHRYDMAALGYRDVGEKRYFDMALFYDDRETAAADGQEIIKRMNSYYLSIPQPSGNVLFTDIFHPGEPDVKTSGAGAVLKISCEVITEQPLGITLQLGGSGMPVRDLLFLAPDPSQYVAR
jgi:hypothetical protein